MASKRSAPAKTRPGEKSKSKGLTWKGVFLTWLLCVGPVAGYTGYKVYERYPAPFKVAYDFMKKGYNAGVKAAQDYQKQRAAAQAEEEKKAKAAAAAAAAEREGE